MLWHFILLTVTVSFRVLDACTINSTLVLSWHLKQLLSIYYGDNYDFACQTTRQVSWGWSVITGVLHHSHPTAALVYTLTGSGYIFHLRIFIVWASHTCFCSDLAWIVWSIRRTIYKLLDHQYPPNSKCLNFEQKCNYCLVFKKYLVFN